MEIVIGSQNGPKKKAVVSAFRKVYPDKSLDIQTVAAESGVADHPTTAEESIKGAENRLRHAREIKPDADFYVGIEGGLLGVNDIAWELGWVAIENQKGELHTGISAGIEVKGKVLKAIVAGQELNEVLRDGHGIENAGNSNGFYGVATKDLVTREQAYEEAVIFALAPFNQPEYFQ